MAFSLGDIIGGFTGSTAKDAAERAAAQNRQLYQAYGTQAQDALAQAERQAAGQYERAAGAYAPLSALGTKYGAATDLQLAALGAQGPEAAARARAAFQAAPGYQYQVQQATDEAARAAARYGLLGSGNTLDEIRRRAGEQANQGWQNWIQTLGGYVAPEYQTTGAAASGVAGAYRGLGDIYGAGGMNRVNILGNVTGGQAQANQQEQEAIARSGQTFWNNLIGLGGTVAKAFAPGGGGTLYKVG